MSKIRLLLVAALILGVFTTALRAAPPPSSKAAQASLDVLVNTIRSNRKALVAANLQLTDEEAAKFWPLYDRYQGEIQPIGDRLVAAIQDYTANFKDLSNEKALKILDDYLAIEADRLKVRRA